MFGDTISVFRPIYDVDINSLGQLHVSGMFNIDCNHSYHYCAIGATDKYLLYFQDPQSMIPLLSCPLTFDLKFQILREGPWINENYPGKPIGIRFQKQLENGQFQVLILETTNTQVLDQWLIFLERHLNQRNFHTLFKAKRKIGKGAFATVYLAERLIDKQMVAVKAFSKQKQYSGQQGKQSLINQINLLRKFNDPHILKLLGVYETQNSIYVTMEILEGRQLQQRLKNNEISNPVDMQAIIKNLLKALRSLAEKNVIHRDLKPENIMFRQQGSSDLVICDFGLATEAHQEKYLFVRCGTPGFVAPEIINIRDMSTKSQPISDVFSAGLIFHFLLFGRSIFVGKRYQEILSQNRACKFDFSKQIYSKLHPMAFDLLKRMLSTNPKTRISAERALEHPFFSMNPQIMFTRNSENTMQIQQAVPLRQRDLNVGEMIDERDQNLIENSKKYQKITNISNPQRCVKYSQLLTSNYKTARNGMESRIQTGSIHERKRATKISSNHYDKNQKENHVQDYIPFRKKTSFGVDHPQFALRRSKRNSMNQKNVNYQNYYN